MRCPGVPQGGSSLRRRRGLYPSANALAHAAGRRVWAALQLGIAPPAQGFGSSHRSGGVAPTARELCTECRRAQIMCQATWRANVLGFARADRATALCLHSHGHECGCLLGRSPTPCTPAEDSQLEAAARMRPGSGFAPSTRGVRSASEVGDCCSLGSGFRGKTTLRPVASLGPLYFGGSALRPPRPPQRRGDRWRKRRHWQRRRRRRWQR